MPRLRSTNPLVLAALSWCVTLGSFALANGLIERFTWGQPIKALVFGLVSLAFAFPFVCALFLCSHYRSSSDSIVAIVALYISLLLICANVDFDLILHFQYKDQQPFTGVPVVWSVPHPSAHRILIWPHVFQAVALCLHFSVETLSTYNDGQIVPLRWYAKLAVDVQVLMGLGLTVLTVGRYFSQRSPDPLPIAEPQWAAAARVRPRTGREPPDTGAPTFAFSDRPALSP